MKYIDIIIGELRALKTSHKIAFVVIFFLVEQIFTGGYTDWWTLITIEFKNVMEGNFSIIFNDMVFGVIAFAFMAWHNRAVTKWAARKLPGVVRFYDRFKL